jgi:multisubunit Na+/H+ antiporter MnhE subunit
MIMVGAMLAWNGKRWIGAVALVSGLVWLVFARHFSAEGLIGGMMGGIFAAITRRPFQTFWLRLQTA